MAGFIVMNSHYFFAGAAFAGAAGAAPLAGAAASSWRKARVVTTDTIGMRGEFKTS